MSPNPATRVRRAIDGILLLDKPLGISSNAALQKVKYLLNAYKAGHTGSLDPLATGMLPICLGEATKFSQYLLDADKTYCVSAQLGVKTSTGDAEGEVISQQSVPVFTKQQLTKVLQHFVGTIQQVPPMFSALKVGGRVLYQLARQGISVERQARSVHISQLDLLEYEGSSLRLQVSCSKGTYIRTLVEDIGDRLGCGAHVTLLRRLSVAGYQSEQMLTLTQLEHFIANQEEHNLANYLLPLDSAVQHWPSLTLTTAEAYRLLQGQKINLAKETIANSNWIRLQLSNGSFFGVGEINTASQLIPRRLLENSKILSMLTMVKD